ncbi:hypothetical protein QIS02_gp3 [ssRNA phage Gephyllon.2_7]|uniref:Uncharacterized protein n=2 Tax=Leviviricetes TaxID=2842243 RepID=A0A8S5KYH7_9VIRU|nr:hypothetical protein QIS02_gp3 [ssRNA phage Gephyllon.2_7]QDH90336.1 MAG: hypothetical protein H2BulkLitter12320_000003 [Leviviridae sp.]DAD50473.1 TPA_asm: hypothetical protein [ssRNA phage Gephyllon.2_7]
MTNFQLRSALALAGLRGTAVYMDSLSEWDLTESQVSLVREFNDAMRQQRRSSKTSVKPRGIRVLRYVRLDAFNQCFDDR